MSTGIPRERENRASGKTQLGFIGLGIMGAPMAANLVRAGFDVAGYNRSPARIEELVAAGGRGAADIAAAVRGADVVATMVPDSPDVQAVLAGEGGVFERARPGALIIDFSSIRPDVAAALAAEGAGRGFRMLDAPVSGGEQGAIEGVLSIMVGGAAADFEAAAPVFAAIGRAMSTPEWHGLPFGLALLPLLLLDRRLRGLDVVIGAQALFYLYVFFSVRIDAVTLVATSLPRLVLHLLPVVLVGAAIALDGRGRTAREGAGAAAAGDTTVCGTAAAGGDPQR